MSGDSMTPEETKQKMLDLIKKEGNETCAECGAPEPQWCSVNLGVVVCTTCSGIHRNLGVHISRVKSLFLDNWKVSEYEPFEALGNLKGMSVWEASMPPDFVRPDKDDSAPLREHWIKAKYQRKLYTEDKVYEKTTKLPQKQGHLTKRGGKRKSWKVRWFVLMGSILSYYKKETDPYPIGVIDLTKLDGKIDCLDEPLTDKFPHTFVIQITGREFFIAAKTPEELYDWIQVLRTAKLLSSERAGTRRESDINLADVLPQLKEGFSIDKFKVAGKMYSDAFSGTNAVDWLVHNLQLSRPDATALGSRLLSDGHIQGLNQSTFVDDCQALYSFK